MQTSIKRQQLRGGMSLNRRADPIFNISDTDEAVAKLLPPWTPSGVLHCSALMSNFARYGCGHASVLWKVT